MHYTQFFMLHLLLYSYKVAVIRWLHVHRNCVTSLTFLTLIPPYFSVVHVRETRLTTLISHLLIAVSMLMLPTPLNYIPIAVLYGKFAQTTFSKNKHFKFGLLCWSHVQFHVSEIHRVMFSGLFMFLAITALKDFQLWERMLLIFTEQVCLLPGLQNWELTATGRKV